MKKERIDRLLVAQNFADSIAGAQALVMSGVVLINEKRVEKASELFKAEDKIRLKNQKTSSKYVSRGGLKLERALEVFNIRPNAYVCLDVGASTGGFTDYLLQNGAERVVTVDSGTNQLDWKIRSDARVDARENVNARFLQPSDFEEPFDLIVMDVSFISVTMILPALTKLLKPEGRIVVLIKPQFEVRRADVGQGGIVRDPEKHIEAVEKVNNFAGTIGLKVSETIDSPILGAEGNKEFLALYEQA